MEIRRSFETQLQSLKENLMEMGQFVRRMLQKAMQALVEQDIPLAQEVISDDDVADAMDINIETKCIRLIALQQPMAGDLRVIGTVIKVIADLERVGDYSVDIAKTAIRLAGEKYFKPLELISKMANIVDDMIGKALTAFLEKDLQLAQEVCNEDDEIDHIYKNLFDELLDYMRKDPNLIYQATYFLFVARYLERCADHIVNVAERVNYMVTGQLLQLAPSHRSTAEE
ncbi:phosphate signaling complex protein PhoU [bacterium]|nr:phosphate signaling complex protein PhoU [bacterium]